jgi:hypothetical protein
MSSASFVYYIYHLNDSEYHLLQFIELVLYIWPRQYHEQYID